MSKWVDGETDNWELLNRGAGIAGQGKQTMNNEVPILTTRTGEVWSITATPGAVELIAPANYKDTVAVFGINVGSPDDLAALVRDARRFRKLAARYCDDASGRPTHGSIQLERWDAEWMDWVPLSDRPLAEIADALPEVEQK